MTSSAQLGCACVCVEDYEEKWSERYLQQAASMQKAQLQGKERGGAVPVPARPGRGRRDRGGQGRPGSPGIGFLSACMRVLGAPRGWSHVHESHDGHDGYDEPHATALEGIRT